METQFIEVLNELTPISLEEVKGIKLMRRIDRKYLTKTDDLLELLRRLKSSYSIQESDGVMVFKYMTLYFDTPELSLFKRHHNGSLTRDKIRLRWYCESGCSYFEIKQKDNRGYTTKKRVKIPDGFDSSREIVTAFKESDSIVEDFLIKNSFLKQDQIDRCIKTRFRRITLIDKIRSERVTIDFDIEFENMKTGKSFSLRDLVVIETKQDSRRVSAIKDFLMEMRIKETGFSKYCIGSILTDNTLKKNLFKMKLMEIDKLTHYKNGIIY